MGYFGRDGGPEIPEQRPQKNAAAPKIAREENTYKHYIVYTPAGNISILADYYRVYRQEAYISFYEDFNEKEKLVATFSLNTVFGVSDISNDRQRRPEYWSE